MSQFPSLVALIYSEFHPTEGPKIICQIPADFLSPQVFDSISEFIIPKATLCDQLVGISAQDHKVVGYPIKIEHEKYPRNFFMFNLCFVFEKGAMFTEYKQVIKKMALNLKAVEIESGYLSNPDTCDGLLSIIDQVFSDLNTYHECQIYISMFLVN